MGYEAPLRYRILPVDQFANIGALLSPSCSADLDAVVALLVRATARLTSWSFRLCTGLARCEPALSARNQLCLH